MVEIFKGDSINELFVKVARRMLELKDERHVRGLDTIEINDAWLILKKPCNRLVTLKSRDMSHEYLHGEMKWYESGDLRVSGIEKYSSFWKHLADSNGTVNSNYGFLTHIEKHAGISQYEWCVNRLKKDINTRQAIMNYNQPRHKYEHVKDFICTISQQFIMRDGKLDCIVLMRSNDLIYGLTYDIVWFVNQQIQIANELDVKVGTYNHYATSLHVYSQHYEMLENMAKELLSDE